jgi:hypothetical protein
MLLWKENQRVSSGSRTATGAAVGRDANAARSTAKATRDWNRARQPYKAGSSVAVPVGPAIGGFRSTVGQWPNSDRFSIFGFYSVACYEEDLDHH